MKIAIRIYPIVSKRKGHFAGEWNYIYPKSVIRMAFFVVVFVTTKKAILMTDLGLTD